MVVNLKKNILALLVISCLLTLTLKAYKIPAKAESTKIVDDNGGPGVFTKIQDAINAAKPGDTIFVRNGTYAEHISINKSLSIFGESVESTIISGNHTGTMVSIFFANNVNFSGFTLTRSGFNLNDSAIRLEFSNKAIVSNNKILMSANGISLSSSHSNTISNNYIATDGWYGVWLYSSSNNIICSNYLSRNLIGFYLVYSLSNIFFSNTLSGNDWWGIYLDLGSSNNTFYHNNISEILPATSTQVNAWSYGNEGNYWNSYNGKDLNGDGIGDSPYVIDKDNRDEYPLMGWFYDFSIPFNGKTYSVGIVSNSTISNFTFIINPEVSSRKIQFNAIPVNSSAGFARISIPVALMNHPLIALLNNEQIDPKILNTADSTRTCFYLSYVGENSSITIIYSEVLHLYYELLDKYTKLQEDFSALSDTCLALNNTYNELLDSYERLQMDLQALNSSYLSLQNSHQELQTDFRNLNETYYNLLNSYNNLRADLNNLNNTYNYLLNNYISLQANLDNLNSTYHNLLTSYTLLQNNFNIINSTYNTLLSSYTSLQTKLQILNETFYTLSRDYNNLLGNYTSLEAKFDGLNASYIDHMRDYSEQMQNLKNLMYIFAATAAVFIATTVYLSKKAHMRIKAKNRSIGD